LSSGYFRNPDLKIRNIISSTCTV